MMVKMNSFITNVKWFGILRTFKTRKQLQDTLHSGKVIKIIATVIVLKENHWYLTSTVSQKYKITNFCPLSKHKKNRNNS